MLLKLEGEMLISCCEGCKEISTSEINPSSIFLFEGSYTFYPNPCKNCNLVEHYNINLSLSDIDDVENESIPYLELNQRYYIRQLMNIVRPDLRE